MTIRAWRIVKTRHVAAAFTGDGARLHGGRWNAPGVPVVYTSGSQALAALELLVHLNPPVTFSLAAIPVEFDASLIARIDRGKLPADWRAEPVPASTRALGDEWVRSGAAAVLEVPSVIIPAESNYVLNPRHPHFSQVRVGAAEAFVFDARLA